MINHLIIIAIIILTPFISKGQKKTPTLNIYKTSGKITVDGVLNEEAWKKGQTAKDFYQSTPIDTSFAKTKTEVKITYDNKNIYVSAICYESIAGEHIIQSLKRDFSYPISDAFAVYIDPFNDHQNGFSFAVNPKGVQREGLIQVGGNYGVTTSWDNYWKSAVLVKEDKWIVEMAIPFTSIRFNPGTSNWSINFSRNDLKRNEGSSWAAVPRNLNIASLAFCGKLIWDKPVQKSAQSLTIIPYIGGGFNKNYNPKTKTKYKANIGVDAKIGITSSLQLDLTVNPDFSQIEVDKQVTNLSRFSLFFPERRNFFIENSDLFSNFGFRKIRPFFSRKIGLDNGKIIPILGGAKLSGKVGNDWRIGAMNIQTEGIENHTPQNYSIAVVQKKVLKNSNIGIIALNRQGFNDKKINSSDFNRIIGADFNYASLNRKWAGKTFYHHSFSPNIKQNNFAHASFARYNSRKLTVMWNHEYVGNNYFADFGFVPRQNIFNPITRLITKKTFWRIEPFIGYTYYPKKSNFYINQSFNLYSNQYYDSKLNTTDFLIQFKYNLLFKNTSKISIFLRNNYTQLFFNTDVSFTGKTPINAGDYIYKNFYIKYATNKRKKLYAYLGLAYGQYYNGTKNSYEGGITYRLQPYGSFSFNIQQNQINLPVLLTPVSLTLLGLKTNLAFTKKIFFSSFLQYNTQAKNFNVNSRLQWRFKPMSDLYLVYSENYLTTNTSIKNRGLLLKFIYWLQ